MRIAHIILAHKNPAQLERLLKTMRHPSFDFYIHLDKKFKLEPFKHLADLPQVNFIKNRMVCNWGGFSLVETVIKSIDQVLDSGINYDFVNLLSAQDYPLKPMHEIHAFFNERLGQSYISFDSSNDTIWWKEAEQRYKKYHFTDMNFIGKYAIQGIINKILPERSLPSSLKHLYGGNKSCWWTISIECAKYLSVYFKSNPAVVKFLKFTWAADEFILPTILMNSPFRDNIVAENYRYMEWTYGETHPKILTADDYNKMSASGMLFARKFDDAVDENIMNKLDAHIHNGHLI